MSIYCFICTRDKNFPTILKGSLSFFKKLGAKPYVAVGETSIFKAFSSLYNKVRPNDDDIIILCHDDILIQDKPEDFKKTLEEYLTRKDVGFVGPAGAAYFTDECVWWNNMHLYRGLLRGSATHGKLTDPKKWKITTYGPPGSVVVLDGLFLAARGETLKKINLNKPKEFEGEWDYYDIWYTYQTWKQGLLNYAIPMKILHESSGEIQGRESWEKNRLAFAKLAFGYFPMMVKNEILIPRH